MINQAITYVEIVLKLVAVIAFFILALNYPPVLLIWLLVYVALLLLTAVYKAVIKKIKGEER